MPVNNSSIIHIETGNCAECYQCIRQCSEGAISYNLGACTVVEPKCIHCARCIDSCPQNLITYSSHIDRCKEIIKKNDIIVASISPGWISEFENMSPNKIVEALILLGFTHVSETTLGAESVINESFNKVLNGSRNLNIASVCPAVNRLIENDYHALIENLVPVDSPTIVHARQIKHWFGLTARVINIGGCVAAKAEVNSHEELISASITFDELKEWLTEEGVPYEYMIGHNSYKFEPMNAKLFTSYIISGGVFNEVISRENIFGEFDLFNVSGIDSVKSILDSIKSDKFERLTLVELFACKGGCLYGEAATNNAHRFTKLRKLRNYSLQNMENKSFVLPQVPFTKQFKQQNINDLLNETSIIETLQSLSIDTTHELINCGGCGYKKCRDFAIQVLRGYASKDMCLWHKKSVAEDAFNKLVNNLQSGVAVIDSSLKFVNSNRNFAAILGSEALLAYDIYPKLKNFDIKRIVPFYKYIENAFTDKDAVIVKDIQIKERLIKVLIANLEHSDRVVVVIRNLFQSDVQSDEIINRTRSVINDNLETVQKIAYLLGETASRTEAVLNSIIESQINVNESK